MQKKWKSERKGRKDESHQTDRNLGGPMINDSTIFSLLNLLDCFLFKETIIYL